MPKTMFDGGIHHMANDVPRAKGLCFPQKVACKRFDRPDIASSCQGAKDGERKVVAL